MWPSSKKLTPKAGEPVRTLFWILIRSFVPALFFQVTEPSCTSKVHFRFRLTRASSARRGTGFRLLDSSRETSASPLPSEPLVREESLFRKAGRAEGDRESTRVLLNFFQCALLLSSNMLKIQVCLKKLQFVFALIDHRSVFAIGKTRSVAFFIGNEIHSLLVLIY